MTPAMTQSGPLSPHTWRDEIVDLVRGISGACIFAIPLIYTFEMWSRGASLSLWHLLVFLSIALSMNFLLDYFAGFKLERSPSMVAVQAIESRAIGIVTATVLLLALGFVFGDWIVLGYCLAGLLAFRLLVIPAEEQQLLDAFGEEYECYQARTGAIFPWFR